MPWLLKMTLFAAALKALIDLYVGWRLTRAVDYLNPVAENLWFWGIALFFLCFYLLPLRGTLEFLWRGEVDIISYPRWYFYLFWFGFVSSFQVLIWVVGMDLIKMAANAGGINVPILDQVWGGLLIAVFSLVLFYSGYKLYRDTTRIETARVAYQSDTLPNSLDGFTIAHLTDLQADRYTGEKQLAAYINRTNALEPDLVVVTGDLISYGTEYVELAADQLARVEAPHGVYFVVGDHDYWSGADAINAELRKRGIRVLEAENDYIRVDDASIKLSGVTNVYSRTAPEEELAAVTADSSGSDLKIMLSHQVSESLIAQCQNQGYGMLLAGHTHGGQISVPLFFTRFSAPSFETPYVQGVYRRNGLLINVNSGLGFTLAPIRYNAPPEISLITLKQRR